MKKIFVLACSAAAAIVTASCAHTTSPALPPTAAMPQSAGTVDSLNARSSGTTGWAPTLTRAVPMAGTVKSDATLPQSVPMRIVVGLAMRNRAAAQAMVRNQYTPGSTAFHAFMSPEQFTAEFNPTSSQANDVASYLRGQGFKDVAIEPNHLIVSATGNAKHVEAAFHTSIRATQSSGQLLYANVTPALVPERFRGLVIAVLGLYNI